MNYTSHYPAKILVIDDMPGIHQVISFLLQPEFSIHAVHSGEEALEKVKVISPDLILLDLVMPQMSGIEVLRQLRQTDRDIPVIIFTAYGSVDSAVQAIKLGATDYIEKPFENWKLEQAIREVLKKSKNLHRLSLRNGIIGESPQMQKVWELIEKYGPTDLPILLQGETGTGKELFARAIHEISKRKREAFVPIDCSTIPDLLLESEIFGYEKGAFTGADGSKPGRLAWADKGTLFLDEISNLPLHSQAKLLRLIQERQYVPLGARKAGDVKTIDVRFVGASNADLTEEIQRGTFRADLYYRIAGVCIELPPLRERKGDIQLLMRHFIGKYRKKDERPPLELSDAVMEVLLSYRWPGNVRELEQTMGAIALAADGVVLPTDLPPNLQQSKLVSKAESQEQVKLELSFGVDLTHPIDLKQVKEQVSLEVEGRIIAEAKKRLSLNQTELAKFLGIDPKTLRRVEKGQS